jgi:hypothetical protein
MCLMGVRWTAQCLRNHPHCVRTKQGPHSKQVSSGLLVIKAQARKMPPISSVAKLLSLPAESEPANGFRKLFLRAAIYFAAALLIGL